MIRFRSTRALGAVAALALLAACDNPAELEMAPAEVGDGIFDRYVAMGNSITAGYQAGGINDATQRESYAFLLAQQMGTTYNYASLAGIGCPPPVVNFQTQGRLGGAGVTDKTCQLRDPASVSTFLNNVAVPGATTLDPTSPTTDASNALTTFILGGRTQVQAAKLADPTFVSIWIGNNDVLEAGVSGVLTPLAGVSRGVTAQATFVERYDQMLDELMDGNEDLEGVLIGVVDVRQVPILFPAVALLNPQFRAGFEQYTGTPVTVLPNCTATTTALVSFRIVSAIRTYMENPTAPGGHPPVISCAKGQFPPSALVGEVFILDAAEQATIAAAVAGYNAAIAERASERGWAFFDPNGALQQLRQSGQIPTVLNLASPTQTFGTYISLDGVHPAAPAHRLIANGVIGAINSTYSTSIPLLP
jgi:hypothetical protein